MANDIKLLRVYQLREILFFSLDSSHTFISEQPTVLQVRNAILKISLNFKPGSCPFLAHVKTTQDVHLCILYIQDSMTLYRVKTPCSILGLHENVLFSGLSLSIPANCVSNREASLQLL